jgi:hypothetical protein
MSRPLRPSGLTEHEMLITVAAMALKMDDITGADVLDAFRQLGYWSIIDEVREGATVRGVGKEEHPLYRSARAMTPQAAKRKALKYPPRPELQIYQAAIARGCTPVWHDDVIFGYTWCCGCPGLIHRTDDESRTLDFTALAEPNRPI